MIVKCDIKNKNKNKKIYCNIVNEGYYNKNKIIMLIVNTNDNVAGTRRLDCSQHLYAPLVKLDRSAASKFVLNLPGL